MPTTTPDNIYYADGTTPASLATITAAQATSVQAALIGIAKLAGADFTGDVTTTGVLATQGKKIYLQQTTPTAPAAGDIWIKY